MKLSNGFKIGLVLAVFVLLCSSASWADWNEVFYDDFDDGDYDGWSVTNWKGETRQAPDVVPSPGGYSLRGVGSGYTTPPPVDAWISHPVSISDVTEMKIEMRAKSGPQWPNRAAVYLVSSSDCYVFDDYGEAGENETADLQFYINGLWDFLHRYPIGSRAFEWHTFAWTRDANGWWSLSIDGQVEAANFGQDNRLTSFDRVGIMVMRNQSEIEWVRISFVTEPPEPAKLLFRERNKGIPGFDHCGFFTGTLDEVWESHPSYTDDPFSEKLYYDPLKDIFVTVNYDNGVQNEHTLGSFNWCSTSKDHSDVVEADYIDIDSEIAEKLLVFIEAHKSSGFSDLNSGMQPEDQKGGGGTFTCVGLIEAAAESISDLHESEGFIPNIFEAVMVSGPGVFWKLPLLTPSLLRFCVSNEDLVWGAHALVGWFDPVDFILTDPLGRRLGHVAGIGTFDEIPNALYTGDGDWEISLILDPVLGEYYLELYGVGSEYRGAVASIGADSTGPSWAFSGYLEVGKRLTKVLFAKWAVQELLPASKSNKAGRTIPIKFSLRIADSVDPAMPFVYNENLEIRIYDSEDPGTILQTSRHGDTARDYRIDNTEELYITNFKTKKDPAEYVVEIWRTGLPFPVGSFTFEMVK